MKVFISGPMSGKPLCNTHAFYNAERLLKEFGFSVWNPAWQQYPDNTEFTKDDMHHIDNAALHMCDAIYMLEGWEESDGARAEYELAKRFDKIIIHEAEFEKAKDIATNSIFGLTHAKFCSKSMKDIREEAAKKREALLKLNLSHVIKKCNEFDEDIQELFDDMEDRKKDISEQDRRLDCHHNRLMSLTERVDTLSKQYRDLGKELDDYIDDYKEADKAIERRLGTDEEMIDSQLNVNAEFKDRIANVESEVYNLKSVRTDIYSLGLSIKELKDTVRELETKSKKTKKSDD